MVAATSGQAVTAWQPSDVRSLVIVSAPLLKALGHEGLNRFLLSLGLTDPGVGSGPTLDIRVRSLRDYALQHPDAKCHGDVLVSTGIIQEAHDILVKYRGYQAPNVSPSERQAFADQWDKAVAADVRSGEKGLPAPAPDGNTVAESEGGEGKKRFVGTVQNFLREWGAVVALGGTLVAGLAGVLANAGDVRTNFCKVLPAVCEPGPTRPCTIEDFMKGCSNA